MLVTRDYKVRKYIGIVVVFVAAANRRGCRRGDTVDQGDLGHIVQYGEFAVRVHEIQPS
jgi:hypothetical protein